MINNYLSKRKKKCETLIIMNDYVLRAFIEEKLGTKYVENKTVEFAKSFEETSPSTPIFFILSPGVNPLKDVEDLGEKLGFTSDKQNFHNVSLGQGQEVVAEKAMEIAALHGHWVVLQNIHLVKKWLPLLEKNLERYADGSHSSYRVFMSAEPAATPTAHIIPQVKNLYQLFTYISNLYLLSGTTVAGYFGIFNKNNERASDGNASKYTQSSIEFQSRDAGAMWKGGRI
jgi:hypothetical protein